MATNIRHKRSNVPGRVPGQSQMVTGEIAINTADGKIFTKRDDQVVTDLTQRIFQGDTKVEVQDGQAGASIDNVIDGISKLNINEFDTTIGTNVTIENNKNLILKESQFSGQNSISIRTPGSVPSDFTLTLPNNAGIGGQVLTTDGNGNLDFVAPDSLAGNRIYVSKAFGDDDNDGINAPVASLKRASQLAAARAYSPLVTPSAAALDAKALLEANKQWIQFEAIAYIDSTYSTLNFDTEICSRDVGLIVDGQKYDVVLNTNYNTRKAGTTYYNATASTVINSQLTETVDGLGYALDEMISVANAASTTAGTRLTANKATILDIVQNGVIQEPALVLTDPVGVDSGVSNAKNLLLQNLSFIQEEVIAYINDVYTGFTYDETEFNNDLNSILEAVALDLVTGSNYNYITSGLSSQRANGTFLTGSFIQTKAALEYAQPLAEDAANIDQTAEARVRAGFLEVIDILENGAVSTDQAADAIQFPVPTNAAAGTENSVINLQNNRDFLAAEINAYIAANYQNFTYNSAEVTDEINELIDTAKYDTALGTNYNAVTTGLRYMRAGGDYQNSDRELQTLGYLEDLRTRVLALTNVDVSVNAETRVGAAFDEVSDIIQNGIVSTDTSADALVFPSPTGVNQDLVDAKDQLQANKEFIKEEVIAYIQLTYPGFTFNADTCKRDLGYVVDALSYDILYGGNSATLRAASAYLEGSQSQVSGQETQTAAAIAYAAQIIGDIIQGIAVTRTAGNVENQDFNSGNATTSEETVLDTLLGYVEDTITNGNTNHFPAVSYPSITWAAQEYQDAFSDIDTATTTLRADTISFINTKYQSFTYNATKCARDVRYIVDAVSHDVMYGGNFSTLRAAEAYFVGTTSQVSGQEDETEDAYRYFATIVDDIILAQSIPSPYETVLVQNTVSAAGSTGKAAEAVTLVEVFKDVIKGGVGNLPTQTLPDLSWASAQLQQARTDLLTDATSIVTSTRGYVNAVYNLTYDAQKCRRDTKFIVESIAYDLIYGSNVESTDSGLKYYDGVGDLQQLQIAGQEVATADAIEYASTISQKIVQNQTPDTVRQSGVTQTIDLGNPGSSAAALQIGTLYDVVITIIENGPSAAPTPIYPDISAYSQDLQDAHNDLADARFDIQTATIDYLVQTYGGFQYNRAKCRRDIGYIVDSVIFDLEYGGNSKAIYAGKSYNFANAALVQSNQKVETLDGILFAKYLAEKVLSNAFPLNGEYNSGNIWTSFTYDEAKCERDVQLLLDAIKYDMVFNSNYRSVASALRYYNASASGVISGQREQTVAAFQEAKTETSAVLNDPTAIARSNALWDEIIDIVQNGETSADPYSYPTPSGGTGNASDSGYLNARDQVIDNKDFLIDETIAWITSQVATGTSPFNTNFSYNEAKCREDLGYIIDALIYDLTYGGNLQTYDAALAYYYDGVAQYGSGEKEETIAALQRLKTVVGQVILETDVNESTGNTTPQDFTGTAGSSAASSFAEARVQDIISYLQNNGATPPTKILPDITWTNAGLQTEFGVIESNKVAISEAVTDYINSEVAAANALLGNPITYQSTFSQTIDNSLVADSDSIAKIQSGFNIIVDILDNGNLVAPSIDYPQYVNNPTTILMATGDYTEQNPIIIPDGVSVIGDNLRGVIIRPANAGLDMFRVRNGCYIFGFTFRDQIDSNKVPSFTFGACVAFDDVDEEVVSTRGVYVGLPASKPIIAQSPYVQNCSIISFLGGDGVLIDGDKVVDPNIPNIAAEVENPVNTADGLPQQGKSMVANAFTHLGFGGTGWRLINDSYAQIVSCFQIFLLNGSYTQSGGYLSITNSATNFGLFALRSSGFSRNAFTFDRGIIAGTGIYQGLQTIITLGTRRPPVEQFVSRFRSADGVTDQTSSFKNTTTVVGVDSTDVVQVDLVANEFNITSHGLTNGQPVVYFTDGGTALGGLNDEQTYYVNLINDNTFGLYFDDSLSNSVDITALGSGTHRFVVDPEEYYVNEVVESHNVFQTITLQAGTYNFEQGQAITGDTGASNNAAFVYTYDDTTNTLVVSVEKVIFDQTEIRIPFEVGSTIDSDANGNTNILVTGVTTRSDLYKATVTLQSTTDGNIIQNISGLPGRVVWFHRPSICNSSAHTWEYAGSGTDYNALPQNGGETISAYEQVSDLPGRVYSSGTDELGNFKVGDFITAENKTGNITFRNTVTVGELNALKLSLSDVEITTISTDINLGDDDPGGASNNALVTQLAIRSFLENRLGDFIDKNVSTNAVPGGIVQMNSNGTINQELIPATRNFNSIILDSYNGRFEVIEDIPPVSLIVGDIVSESFVLRDVTLSQPLNGDVVAGTKLYQANTGLFGIVTRDYSNPSVVEVANLTEPFSTLPADILYTLPEGDWYSSDSSAIYPTSVSGTTEGNNNLVIVDDSISQALVLFDGNDSANYNFTVGNQIASSLNSAVGTITEYRNGILTSVDVINYTPGSGYVPGGSTQIYTDVPLVTLTGNGYGARADITVTNGVIDNIDIIRGGLEYNVGDTVGVDNANVGGLGSGFETTVLDIQKRLYVDLDTNTKFIGSAVNNDFIQDNNATINQIEDSSALTLLTFDGRDTGSGGDVNFGNNTINIPNHQLETGDAVYYVSSPNTPVLPLQNNEAYFVIKFDNNNIQLADDYTLNNIITLTTSSSGTHSIIYRPVNIRLDILNVRNHGYDTGDSIEVELTSGTIPEGLTNGQRLFVGSVGIHTFSLHTVRADALNSVNGLTQSQVNISSEGNAGDINLIKNNVRIIDQFNTSSSRPEAYSTLTTSNIDASNIVSGVVNPSRLASAGIANSDTYLRGDSSWATAVSSLELDPGTPLNIAGGFSSDSTGTFYFGDLKLSIDTVEPNLGNPNFTNLGVVSVFKQQFDITTSGEITIKDGVIDAGQLGGQLPSYYLDPANLLQEVSVDKGGTGLTAVLQGALLYGSGGAADLTALPIGAANQVLTSSGTAPQWSDELFLDGDLAINGGDLTTTASTFNLVNEVATTVNFAGQSNNLTMGADSSGTTTIRNDLIINGDLKVNGTAITINSTQITVDEPLFNVGGQVITGTYNQGAGSSIVVISTNNHGLDAGDNIYVDFTTTTGSLRSDGTYNVVNVNNEDVFTISSPNTQASSGTVVIYTQTADDNKDRGVTFQYVDGTPKQGFFGWDDSIGAFTIVSDATISGDVVGGAKGAIASSESSYYDGTALISTTGVANVTSIGTAAPIAIDSWPVATYRSAKYTVQIASTTGEQSVSEILVIHNGSTATMTQYGIVRTGSSSLADVTADVASGNVRLLVQATTGTVDVKVTRTLTTI